MQTPSFLWPESTTCGTRYYTPPQSYFCQDSHLFFLRLTPPQSYSCYDITIPPQWIPFYFWIAAGVFYLPYLIFHNSDIGKLKPISESELKRFECCLYFHRTKNYIRVYYFIFKHFSLRYILRPFNNISLCFSQAAGQHCWNRGRRAEEDRKGERVVVQQTQWLHAMHRFFPYLTPNTFLHL